MKSRGLSHSGDASIVCMFMKVDSLDCEVSCRTEGPHVLCMFFSDLYQQIPQWLSHVSTDHDTKQVVLGQPDLCLPQFPLLKNTGFFVKNNWG